MNNLVSIIIPTKNSAQYLENCLRSIRDQVYTNIETIIVDGKSTDATLKLAQKYNCKVYIFVPRVTKGSFDASFKRNYGAKKSRGDYIYWADADMEIPKNLIAEAVSLCKKGADAVILPEDSFGKGIWAQAKNLERRCYWGDSSVECPRFFKHTVWDDIGGLDESLGAGGDDLDIHQKVLEKGYKVARTKSMIMHNEGNLKIGKLFQKHFMYGRDTVKYFFKRPKASVISYFPVRLAYLRNLKLFIGRPLDTCVFIVMRSTEYFAGLLGLLYSLLDISNVRLYLNKKANKAHSPMDIECYAKSLPQYYGTAIPELLKKYLDNGTYRTLLDCGCGDGSLLFALKAGNYFDMKKICAVDLSKNRIELVKKIDPKINALVDNAETLKNISTNSIDFYISSYVIEHVDDKKMIDTAGRVLKKGGIAYISTIYKKWYGWYYQRKNGRWVMDTTHLREYSYDNELIQFIDQKKFIVLENRKKPLYFPLIDFVVRRLHPNNRRLFNEIPILNLIRKIKIPIIGYYDWEIVLKKQMNASVEKKNLVTIIIPTKDSTYPLINCLRTIRNQSYRNIEVIIVDGKSRDYKVLQSLAHQFRCKIITHNPKVKKGLFDATKKRNYAAKIAKGKYLYHLDADMELTPNVIKEAIVLCRKGYDAVIVPEDSFGNGHWARAKNLERRFFWGDNMVESPRFFKKTVWDQLRGYDENIAGGGDDRDIYQRMLEFGYKVGRTQSMVMHNEGALKLDYLIKKQFMYKREILKYIRKRPLMGILSYFPLRKSHFTNWKMFVERPEDTFYFIIMKTAEFTAGVFGIIYSLTEY